MRVYHFTSAQHALTNLEHRRLKIATLYDVNDPFELAVCCDDADRRRALRRTRLQWADKFGMLCFSRDWHNPVQWSHYADKHRGICLGFDAPDKLLTPVQYARNPPDLNWDAIEQGGIAGEAEMIRWSSTKYDHWAYEDEVRAFVSLDEVGPDGLHFFEFGEHLRLREIIIGPRSGITRRQVTQALGELDDVRKFKTRLAFRGYRVVSQRLASQWL